MSEGRQKVPTEMNSGSGEKRRRLNVTSAYGDQVRVAHVAS